MPSSLIRGLALVAATAVLPVAASAQVVPVPPGGGAQQQQGAPGGSRQGGARERRGGSAYMRAIRQLNLSDAQRRQIRQIVRQQAEATRRQIMGVLTPDQRSQLQQQLQQTR